jgi:hypothetical protein
MHHKDRFIAPRTSHVDYEFENGLHYMITSSCTTVSEDETEVYTVISFRYKWFGSLIKLVFQPLAKKIISQDVEMLSAQYANIKKFGGVNFCSTKADLLGKYIYAWNKAIKNNQPLPPENIREESEIFL